MELLLTSIRSELSIGVNLLLLLRIFTLELKHLGKSLNCNCVLNYGLYLGGVFEPANYSIYRAK